MANTTVKLRRVGDSTTMTIPAKILKQLGWKEGEEVELYIDYDFRLSPNTEGARSELIVRRA